MEEQDDLFNEDEGTEDSGSDEGGETTDDAPPQKPKATKDSGSEKRINDLMSKWQSEQAARQRAEAELARLKGSEDRDGGESQSAQSAEANEFLELAREQARSSLFASDPRLAQYGFEVTAIEGNSPKEMQASVAKLRAVIDRVESSARTSVMREFGMNPEVVSGGRDKGFDPATASDKEIAEMADRVLGRL